MTKMEQQVTDSEPLKALLTFQELAHQPTMTDYRVRWVPLVEECFSPAFMSRIRQLYVYACYQISFLNEPVTIGWTELNFHKWFIDRVVALTTSSMPQWGWRADLGFLEDNRRLDIATPEHARITFQSRCSFNA